jgi:hypothetical protein
LIGHPFALSIQGSSLLYNIDLAGSIKPNDHHVFFNLEGNMRMGPLKSEAIVSSIYKIGDFTPQLESHQISFPKISFAETYTLQEDELIYNKNKSSQPVLGQSFLDPLPLFFHLLNLDPDQGVDHQGHLLVGGLNRSYQFIKEHNQIECRLENRLIFTGQINSREAIIKVPRFKMKLKLNRH